MVRDAAADGTAEEQYTQEVTTSGQPAEEITETVTRVEHFEAGSRTEVSEASEGRFLTRMSKKKVVKPLAASFVII